MKKRVLSILLAIVLLMTCIPFASLTVSAGSGLSPRDAIVLTKNEWYTKYWNNSNYDAACYNEITVPSRGYITFSIEKPVDSEGEVCGFYLTLYNSDGDKVWYGNKSTDKDVFNDFYEYKIGLKAGTYYMNIDPSFYVSSYSSAIATSYRFQFTKNSYCEVESNDEFASATTLTLNKKYTGFMSENKWDYDYYQVKLTKFKKYTITVNGISADDCDLRDSGQGYVYFGRYGSGTETKKPNGVVWTYTPTESGYHYIKLTDSPDKDITYTVTVETPKTPISKLKVSLSNTSYVYNGKTKKPSVVVKTAGGSKISSSNYTVTYASGRKNVGKYKVTVKMKGAYSGTKNLYFTIKPPKTTIAKLTPAKTSIKAYVSRKTSQVTGYQIQYSTSKSFKSYKTKNITSYKTGSTSLTGVKRKTTYYVRVRTYKIVNGTKIYSSWTTAKKTKTK
ncbi:MAG: hypothetical protein IIX28_00630 [Clostridia bacterium]|nr:hypothetical protein [Clostridia bacterium]